MIVLLSAFHGIQVSESVANLLLSLFSVHLVICNNQLIWNYLQAKLDFGIACPTKLHWLSFVIFLTTNIRCVLQCLCFSYIRHVMQCLHIQEVYVCLQQCILMPPFMVLSHQNALSQITISSPVTLYWALVQATVLGALIDFTMIFNFKDFKFVSKLV